MLDISVDWPQNEFFYWQTLPMYTELQKCRSLILPELFMYKSQYTTRKVCFKLKSQKNVPANNCHPKVLLFMNFNMKGG